MVTQKPISARLDHDLLQDIEQERFVSGKTTNRIINEGVKYYCHIMDSRRRFAMYGRKDIWNDICTYLVLPELRL